MMGMLAINRSSPTNWKIQIHALQKKPEGAGIPIGCTKFSQWKPGFVGCSCDIIYIIFAISVATHFIRWFKSSKIKIDQRLQSPADIKV